MISRINFVLDTEVIVWIEVILVYRGERVVAPQHRVSLHLLQGMVPRVVMAEHRVVVPDNIPQ